MKILSDAQQATVDANKESEQERFDRMKAKYSNKDTIDDDPDAWARDKTVDPLCGHNSGDFRGI